VNARIHRPPLVCVDSRIFPDINRDASAAQGRLGFGSGLHG
jgi:hypothetical protein